MLLCFITMHDCQVYTLCQEISSFYEEKWNSLKCAHIVLNTGTFTGRPLESMSILNATTLFFYLSRSVPFHYIYDERMETTRMPSSRINRIILLINIDVYKNITGK